MWLISAVICGCSGADAPFPESDAAEDLAAVSDGDAAPLSDLLVGDGEPPVATDDVVVALAGKDTSIDVLSNDMDPGGEMLTFALEDRPAHGDAQVEGGVIVYTPLPRFNGPDAFRYRLFDPSGESSVATVRITVYDQADPGAPQVLLPPRGLDAGSLAVVVNDADPQSVAVAEYYVAARSIPASNVVHLDFSGTGTILSPADFEPLHTQAQASVGDHVQAWAITWTTPYRVGCMSITSAFALGYDPMWCNTSDGSCSDTAPVETYLSDTTRPYDDHGVRPAMMLAGETTAHVMSLIDRGVASDRTMPTHTGYLVRTTDPVRSVRWPQMIATLPDWQAGDGLLFSYVDNHDGPPESDGITGRDDVLFYFTGLEHVPGIETNTFLPGALADHLTSLGGQLTDSSQMSALRWLDAGAVASYGTVVEPCNKVEKFPYVRFAVQFYYRGQTALEAYWKSVHWPGEGVFVGEPLARPFGKTRLLYAEGELRLTTTALSLLHSYAIEAADAPDGPWDPVTGDITIDHLHPALLVVPDAARSFYRLVIE